jgi:hypothetical protein
VSAFIRRRLAGVRVADERDHRERCGRALGLLDVPGAYDVGEPPPEHGDALANPPAVDLELRLAGSPCPDAAAEARQVGPLPRQAGEQVLELRELDLQLALGRPRALREDVEDEGAPVDDLAAEGLLQVALLRGRQSVVEHDHVAVRRRDEALHLLDLAGADVGRRLDAP